MSSDDWFRRDHHILYLSIQLQARAGEDAVVGVRNGRLLLRIKAPPVDGKANHRLVEFLADRLGVPVVGTVPTLVTVPMNSVAAPM